MELDDQTQAPLRKRHVRRVLALLCLFLVMGYVWIPPVAPLDKARLIGYSICHQIPDRSFHLAEHRLPLCARCTGTYLGVAISFAVLALLRRWRSGEMLSMGMVIVMVCLIGIMGVDGLNSYLYLITGRAYLYTPQNWLRAATGALNGIALTMIVTPIFNFTLWKQPSPDRPLKSVWELLAILAAAAVAVFVVQSEPSWLLYPVSLLTTAGVLWMLALVNTMILLILFRRDSQAETWREALASQLFGLIATLIELTAMGVFRYLITGTMGWPLAM